MQRLDRRERIDFVDVSEGGTGGSACPIDQQTLLARFHAREQAPDNDSSNAKEAGNIVSGAAAFAAMWRAIPLLRPLGLLARNRVVLAMLEVAYRAFLKLRPALQKFFGWLDRGRSARAG